MIKNIKASRGYVSIVTNRNSNCTYDIMGCTKDQLHNIGLDFPNQSQSNYDIKKFGKEGGKDKEGEEDGSASSCYSTYFCLPNPMYGSFTSVPEPPLSVQ